MLTGATLGYALILLGGIGIVGLEYFLLYALLIFATANFGSPSAVSLMKKLLVGVPLACVLTITLIGTWQGLHWLPTLALSGGPIAICALVFYGLKRSRRKAG